MIGVLTAEVSQAATDPLLTVSGSGLFPTVAEY